MYAENSFAYSALKFCALCVKTTLLISPISPGVTSLGMRFSALFPSVLLLCVSAGAQTPERHPARETTTAPAQLKFELIVSRHGIRPPLVEATTLNSYASDPWPVWEVPLGHLTPHGAAAIAQMGAYLRLRLVEDGLLTPGCPAPSEIYLYSDTDERNVSSTRETFAALAPNCEHLDINTMAPSTANAPDPLFQPVPKTFPAPNGAPAMAAVKAALHNDPAYALSANATPELRELAHILAPDPARPAAKPILDQPVEVVPGTYGATAHGPLVTASNLVEDLELEYIDARPLNEVGWGRLGSDDKAVEAALQRLLPIHIKAFGLGLRTPLFARAQGSNLLSHLLATLEQADVSPSAAASEPGKMGIAVRHDVPGAIGPAGTKLVYLSGHDANLFELGGLLDLHWTADGRMDDTPPDSQLAFELWQHPGERDYEVRIKYRAQTLEQLRAASPLTLENPPAEVEVTPTGCIAHHACSLATFLKAARAQVDPAYVQPALVPVQVVR